MDVFRIWNASIASLNGNAKRYNQMKVGFLNPYSSFYPYYSPQIIAGLCLGMGLDPSRQKLFQFLPVYSQTGAVQAVTDATRKALFFDQCHLLSGLISYNTMADIIPIIEQMNRLAFFFDLGEYLPGKRTDSPNVFYNSHQLWQAEYTLGFFAQSEFGDGGFTIAPVYDSGYHLGSVFRAGLSNAGGHHSNLYVLPFDASNPHNLFLTDIFNEIEAEQPPYVHALFSGQQGIDFLATWVEYGLHKKVPLLVSDMMIQEDVLDDLKHLNVSLYAPSLWQRSSQHPGNQAFVKTFESKAQHRANIFALLGYEMGMAFHEIRHLMETDSWDEVGKRMRELIIEGPRGVRNFYPASGYALPSIDILKVKLGSGKIQTTIVDQRKGMLYNEEVFHDIHEETISGWHNPYLCY